jgi:C_GCAxxG_C_C family probable redox protein
MDKSEEALELFQKGFNCAQSVFCVFGTNAGFSKDACLRIAGSFGAGMARRGETCGAVTGGLMVLGLRHGMVKEENAQAKQRNYEEADKFMVEFGKRNGSVICRELLGCDIGTPEGAKYAADNQLTMTLCSKLVASAVEILEKNVSRA